MSICFSFLLCFWSILNGHFYISVTFTGKFVSLRMEVWARGRPFEVCLLSSFYIKINQNKTLIPLWYLTAMDYCSALHQQNHSSHLNWELFRAAFSPPACFRARRPDTGAVLASRGWGMSSCQAWVHALIFGLISAPFAFTFTEWTEWMSGAHFLSTYP